MPSSPSLNHRGYADAQVGVWAGEIFGRVRNREPNSRSQALQRAFKGNKTFSLLVGAMGSRRLVSTREDWMGLQGPSCSRQQLLGLLPLCSALGQSPPLPALKQGHTKGNVRELDAKRVISMNLGGTICQLSDS